MTNTGVRIYYLGIQGFNNPDWLNATLGYHSDKSHFTELLDRHGQQAGIFSLRQQNGTPSQLPLATDRRAKKLRCFSSRSTKNPMVH